MGQEWAVVAGASGALGGAISDRLIVRGLEVVGIARHADARRGIVGADIRDADAIARAVERISGPVRVVVHAAGPELTGGLADVDPDSLLDAFDVKVGGLVRLTRAIDQRLVVGSRIIAVTGHLGYDPIPEAISAGVANAALAALVKQLAAFYGPRGITCHGIAPGPVESPRVERLIEHMVATSTATHEEVRADLIRDATVRRLADVDDIAWAVDLLLDDAAVMMNGSTLFLDGGRRTAIP